LITAAVLLYAVSGIPSTIYVPDDHPDIQTAITASSNGDAVIVRPGTYVENINLMGKSITLRSDLGSAVTVILGNLMARVVTFNSGEGPDTLLEGFTITNGAGGILCSSSAPTIRGNIITDNHATDSGGGIRCEWDDPVIEGNLVSDNTTMGDGGGIASVSNSNPLVLGNVIRGNYCRFYGGGIECIGQPEMINNIIADNTADLGGGGGIDVYNIVNPIIRNNTIYGNRSLTESGGGINVDMAGARISNTVLWNNSADTGPQLSVFNYPSYVSVNYSDVEGGEDSVHVSPTATLVWGDSMIEEDPALFDPGAGDFRLTQYSPCINRGTNEDAPVEDFEGDPRPYMGTVDMGADEFGGTHSLGADVFTLSAATGGVVNFHLFGGAPSGGRMYLLLGSVTGMAPGTGLPGGLKILPLNWDVFTDFVLGNLNTPAFQNFWGNLTWGSSTAWAALDVQKPLPGLAGITLHFAYCLNNPFDFASNPVQVDIIP
jgi:hypothetical protein